MTVACDSAGAEAAAPWIRRASPTHPSLIDRRHRVAELYNQVNVPTAVWIDEDGRIVRPPEPPGTFDGFRRMDRQSFKLPEDVRQEYSRRNRVYADALRDWAHRGEASEFALAAAQVEERQPAASPEARRAAACFRLGEYLAENGRFEEGAPWLEEAIRLRPESWNFFRQKLALGQPEAAGGPEFWRRVDELGQQAYYPPVRMPGLDG